MEQTVGRFSEEITLVNDRDRSLVAGGVRKEARQVTVKAVVDTGAMTLVISEATCQALGLDLEETRMARVADGRQVESKVTSPVQVRWKNRSMICAARMVPGAANTLLGAIPLEDMDLMVDIAHQCLVGVHGNEPLDEID